MVVYLHCINCVIKKYEENHCIHYIIIYNVSRKRMYSIVRTNKISTVYFSFSSETIVRTDIRGSTSWIFGIDFSLRIIRYTA